MSSFSDISQDTEAILDSIRSSMQPSSIERLWELISWWCASGDFRMTSHFLEIIFMKLFHESYKKIDIDKNQLWEEFKLLLLRHPQQNIQQPQQNMQLPQQNIQQPQQNIQQHQQDTQLAQENIQCSQQLGQDFPPPGGNETPQQTQQRLRLSQVCWQGFQESWQYEQQQGRGSQQDQNEMLNAAHLWQLMDTLSKLWLRLQNLRQRLQQKRQQPQGDLHLPQQLHQQQGESGQHMEELLILACQVLTALPENDTLMGYLVHGIMYADVAGVPIEKAASYLSTTRLTHISRALETKRIEGDFTLAAATLRKLARERSLQNLNVVSILQSAKGDPRRVWSLTELPEPLKELFHIPFQELYKELKQ